MQSPVLILGASGGVGSQIARTLSRDKDQILILQGRNGAALQALAEELGPKAQTVVADMTDSAAVMSLFQRIRSDFTHLSAVVFSIAASFQNRLAHNTPWDVFQLQFETQLKALHLCCAGALPLLSQKSQTSRMIVVGSEFAATAPAKTAAYASAKAAMTTYAQVIAKEWIKKNVRVHVVAPGLMRTGMTKHLPAEFLEQIVEQMPERRLTEPDDVAGVVAFLLTDAADALYGVPLFVSRGSR